MYTITLLIGLVCGASAQLPEGQCKAPHTTSELLYNPTKGEQAQALQNCNSAAEKLTSMIRQRGAESETAVFCTQRTLGGVK